MARGGAGSAGLKIAAIIVGVVVFLMCVLPTLIMVIGKLVSR